jgi:hypothetical protein
VNCSPITHDPLSAFPLGGNPNAVMSLNMTTAIEGPTFSIWFEVPVLQERDIMWKDYAANGWRYLFVKGIDLLMQAD